MRRILTSVLVVAAGAAYQAQAPQSGAVQETFRTGVELVRLDVSVLDKDRRPIRGLTAQDFTILEDGKPQPIAAFSAIEPDRFQSGRSADCQFALPLARLAEGEYLLTVEASAAKTSARREVRFRVEASER